MLYCSICMINSDLEADTYLEIEKKKTLIIHFERNTRVLFGFIMSSTFLFYYSSDIADKEVI